MLASDTRMNIHATEEESAEQVFKLIDHQSNGAISEAALAQALLQTALFDEHQARATAAEAARDGRKVDRGVFLSTLQQAVEDHKRAQSEAATTKRPSPISLGSALLGIVQDLRTFYADTRRDYRLANYAKAVFDQLKGREQMQRKNSIALRQESEHQGVQEAQMMQAMEFNSAWSQNMTEFERQAREIEEGAVRRHQEEYAAFQTKMSNREPASYKFSRELLNLKASIEAQAKQGNYDEAHKVKRKADQLERWERLKMDNQHKTLVAQKELQLRQQQQTQLEALKRRIQRGREEHKEHWLMGAQRLMQSHRNMLSDLKSKQALENLRSDVSVKLDITAHRVEATKAKIRSNYAGTLPRVNTGAAVRNKGPGIASRKALSTSG